MLELSNNTGSVSDSETSGENRDSTGYSSEDDARKEFYKNLIIKANNVPLMKLFQHYHVLINNTNNKIICPFKNHKNGRERTPSFTFYPETNSFKCYGCNVGHANAHGVEFMSEMEGLSRSKAAKKIIELFDFSFDEKTTLEEENYSERIEMMMSFSNQVRKFRNTYNDENSFQFIEEICNAFDVTNSYSEKDLHSKALKHLIDSLLFKINSYKK